MKKIEKVEEGDFSDNLVIDDDLKTACVEPGSRKIEEKLNEIIETLNILLEKEK